MLPILTKYLLHYHKLAVPHVGTFELVQQPPSFNVVDKVMLPPSYQLQWRKEAKLDEHQLIYLAEARNTTKNTLESELDQFGKHFRTHLQQSNFIWNGIGTVRAGQDHYMVETAPIRVEGFEPVAAHKVLREHASHNMLVGDQQMTTQQVTDSLRPAKRKWPAGLIIGWILLLLAITAIIYLLYEGNFDPRGSGLRQKIDGLFN